MIKDYVRRLQLFSDAGDRPGRVNWFIYNKIKGRQRLALCVQVKKLKLLGQLI